MGDFYSITLKVMDVLPKISKNNVLCSKLPIFFPKNNFLYVIRNGKWHS